MKEAGRGAGLVKYFCVTLAENFILCIIYPVNNILQCRCRRFKGTTKPNSHLALEGRVCVCVCVLRTSVRVCEACVWVRFPLANNLSWFVSWAAPNAFSFLLFKIWFVSATTWTHTHKKPPPLHTQSQIVLKESQRSLQTNKKAGESGGSGAGLGK